MLPNGSHGSLDLLGYMQGKYQQTPSRNQVGVAHPHHATDARSIGVQESLPPFPLSLESRTTEGLNNYAGDGISSKAFEGGVTKNFDGGKGKEEILWHRIRWTDEMVKVLINAVSYVEEEDSYVGEKGKSVLSPKKSKWRAISDVMVQRGYYVSPKQCEDKFNDLNKKFKRLNAILGINITCHVVENPELVESLELSNETKDEVKKILSCKQLCYEQMCSYHKGTQILPSDPVLQMSLLHALKEKADCAKKMRLGEEREVLRSASLSNYEDYNRSSGSLAPKDHANPINTNGGRGEKLQGEELLFRSLKLEEKKLKLQAQMLELEEERYEWLKCRYEKERDLQKMRMNIEFMKLEYQREALELKRQTIGANDN